MIFDASAGARLTACAALMLLAGCANKYDVITPELQASMLSDLKAGKLNLDCGIKCDFTWMRNASAIHALDLAEKWPDLATRVMQIGYGSDLAYYYLGQAAQGLGYHPAAITYYVTALSIESGPNALLKCEAGQSQLGGDPCQGVDLASSIPVLMQASRDAMAQQAAEQDAAAAPVPKPHHRHHTPAPVATTASSSATPAPSVATGGSGWAVPPPPPAPSQ